jgi:hypothetical protein
MTGANGGRDISHRKPRRGPAPHSCDAGEHADCKAERDTRRKARERASACNPVTRVALIEADALYDNVVPLRPVGFSDANADAFAADSAAEPS